MVGQSITRTASMIAKVLAGPSARSWAKRNRRQRGIAMLGFTKSLLERFGHLPRALLRFGIVPILSPALGRILLPWLVQQGTLAAEFISWVREREDREGERWRVEESGSVGRSDPEMGYWGQGEGVLPRPGSANPPAWSIVSPSWHYCSSKFARRRSDTPARPRVAARRRRRRGRSSKHALGDTSDESRSVSRSFGRWRCGSSSGACRQRQG